MNCKNCKCHKIDNVDGVLVDYCYPPMESGFLSCKCSDRKRKHRKQCMSPNDKMSLFDKIKNKL